MLLSILILISTTSTAILLALIYMAKTADELATEIRAANAQTRKGIDEVLKKIADLEAAVGTGDLSKVEAAVAELTISTQALDDIVPDAPAPTP